MKFSQQKRKKNFSLLEILLPSIPIIHEIFIGRASGTFYLLPTTFTHSFDPPPWILIMFDQLLNWIFSQFLHKKNLPKTTKFLFMKIGLNSRDSHELRTLNRLATEITLMISVLISAWWINHNSRGCEKFQPRCLEFPWCWYATDEWRR